MDTENKTKFLKAGPNKRVFAFLIDNGIASTAGILAMIAMNSTLANWLSWIFLILIKDCLFNGQSIGKCAAGITIIDDNDNPPVFYKAILRNITLIIPLVPLVEFAVMFYNAKGKRLGDSLAGTRVHDLKPWIKDVKFIWLTLLTVIILSAIQLSLLVHIVKKYPLLLPKI